MVACSLMADTNAVDAACEWMSASDIGNALPGRVTRCRRHKSVLRWHQYAAQLQSDFLLTALQPAALPRYCGV